MRAGRLRHRVEIQQQVATRDAFNTPVNQWTTVASVRAAVEPLLGREFYQSQQVNAEVTTKVTLRNRDGILPRMRVLYDGRWYDIQSIQRVREVRHEMVLMCNELVERPE